MMLMKNRGIKFSQDQVQSFAFEASFAPAGSFRHPFGMPPVLIRLHPPLAAAERTSAEEGLRYKLLLEPSRFLLQKET